jgi:hypothetical protein
MDPKAGRVYSENVKSIRGVGRVYLTRAEKLSYGYFLFFTMAFALTGYVLNLRWRCFAPFIKK